MDVPKQSVKVIKGGTLIDGTGAKPIENATIVIKDVVINAVCEEEIKIPAEAQVIDATGKTVMPGLIDAHVHLIMSGEPNPLIMLQYSPGFIAFKAAKNAQMTLESGITTVRDLGDAWYFCLALKKAIEVGIMPGPRMMVSGKVISQTGGHGDFYLPSGISLEWGSRIADGVDDVRKAAREQLREGVDVVKICTSGGVLSPSDVAGARQFTVEEIRAAVDEAQAVGKRVAAHAHGTQGIKNAILAGVNTIEHGTLLDDEAIKMMAERGIFLVPTLSSGYNIMKYGGKAGIPEYAIKKEEELVKLAKRGLREAAEAGVKIAMGTDSGTPFNTHGANALELQLMVEAGFTEMEAIVASTKTAAEALGLEKLVGTIEKGKLADIILVEGNPLKEIKVLQDKRNIAMVVKNGEIVVRREV